MDKKYEVVVNPREKLNDVTAPYIMVDVYATSVEGARRKAAEHGEVVRVYHRGNLAWEKEYA